MLENIVAKKRPRIRLVYVTRLRRSGLEQRSNCILCFCARDTAQDVDYLGRTASFETSKKYSKTSDYESSSVGRTCWLRGIISCWRTYFMYRIRFKFWRISSKICYIFETGAYRFVNGFQFSCSVDCRRAAFVRTIFLIPFCSTNRKGATVTCSHLGPWAFYSWTS